MRISGSALEYMGIIAMDGRRSRLPFLFYSNYAKYLVYHAKRSSII